MQKGSSVLARHGYSVVKALLSIYPSIGLDESKFAVMKSKPLHLSVFFWFCICFVVLYSFVFSFGFLTFLLLQRDIGTRGRTESTSLILLLPTAGLIHSWQAAGTLSDPTTSSCKRFVKKRKRRTRKRGKKKKNKKER